MKKILLLFLLVIAFGRGQAQWINGFQILPPVPTSADTLRIYVDCSFPSGPCDLDVQTSSVAGTTMYAYAKHCMGMLTVICNQIDSFIFPPQPPGIYTFRFSLDAGLAPAPCTPGIVPGPTDSVTFAVTLPAGIPVLQGNEFQLHCNPQTGQLTVDLPAQQKQAKLDLYSVDGRWMKSLALNQGSSEWNLGFPPGFYVARLRDHVARPVTFVITR